MAFEQIEVQLLDSWRGARDIAHTAWTSTYDAERTAVRTEAECEDMARRIIRENHQSPKETAFFHFYIRTPIFVERQLDKYRMTFQEQGFQVEYLAAPLARKGISQNELSGRYRTIPERPFEMPPDVAGILDKAYDGMVYGEAAAVTTAQEYLAFLEQQWKWYKKQLELLKVAETQGAITNEEFKRAREVLRGVLGTSYLTDLRITCNLGALEWILEQRLDNHAQVECRVTTYKMLVAARAAPNLGPVVEEMIQAHGWAPLIAEIEAFIAGAKEPT